MKSPKVVVTGGSSGIGRATVESLTHKGASCTYLSRNESLELRGKATWIGCDLADKQSRPTAFQELTNHLDGELDGLVLNAAWYRLDNPLNHSQTEIQNAFEINLFSSIELLSCLMPLLEKGKGKSVVFVSSTLAQKPIAPSGLYSATKAAFDTWLRSMALHFAEKGVRFNSVLPGVVDTPIHEPKSDQDPSKREKLEACAPLHPLGRVGKPEEVAHMITTLLGPESGWITGAQIPVDGGILLA